jgi:hypothetical protein
MKETLYFDKKVTVIKRGDSIVVRLDDGGSCRNAEEKTSVFANVVKNATGCEVEKTTFYGYKNYYSHVWHEAKIIMPTQ